MHPLRISQRFSAHFAAQVTTLGNAPEPGRARVSVLLGRGVPLRSEPKIHRLARAPFVIARPARGVAQSRAARIAKLGLAAAFLITFIAGCGRKASEADCSFILDRNIEVQMKQLNIVDPVAVAKRKDEVRGEMKELLKDCVGKRVTDSMMGCVQRATSTDEIDKCMR